METLLQKEKSTTVMRCPECLNYMKVKSLNGGTFSGKCTVCKSSVFSKQHSKTERRIRIVRNIAN